MENQHRKISGYRELSETEIHLMNAIKTLGQELLDLQEQLKIHLESEFQDKKEAYFSENKTEQDIEEFKRFNSAEPRKWASIGKADIQTGIMALVRAVAQPSTC